MRHSSFRHLLTLGLAFLIGFAVWITAPTFVGHQEPWDGDWPYYTLVMGVGGLLVGLASGTAVVRIIAIGAAWGGQVSAIALTGLAARAGYGNLFLIVTGIGSLFFVPGLLLATWLWSLRRHEGSL